MRYNYPCLLCTLILDIDFIQVKSLQKEIERINGLIKQIRSTEQLEISSNEKEKMHCQLVSSL